MRTSAIGGCAALISSLFVPTAVADVYLCVTERVAGVSNGPQGIQAALINTDAKEFILSNERGAWGVTFLGQNKAFLDRCDSDRCDSEWFCEASSGYGGTFLRDNDNSGTFTITYPSRDGKTEWMIVSKGNCSKV